MAYKKLTGGRNPPPRGGFPLIECFPHDPTMTTLPSVSSLSLDVCSIGGTREREAETDIVRLGVRGRAGRGRKKPCANGAAVRTARAPRVTPSEQSLLAGPAAGGGQRRRSRLGSPPEGRLGRQKPFWCPVARPHAQDSRSQATMLLGPHAETSLETMCARLSILRSVF